MKLAVIGSPIKHSLSPKIHSYFGDSLGLEIQYEAIEVNRDKFKESVIKLFESGYVGLNVTLPLKDLAYSISQNKTKLSQETKTANTLWMKENKIHCDSTDGPGLIGDFKRKNISLKGLNIALIGAGGSARAIAPSLLKENPRRIILINRTKSKAEDLRNNLREGKEKVSIFNNTQEQEVSPEIIINSSSAGIKGEDLVLPNNLFNKTKISYDLSYSLVETPFNLLAKEKGVPTIYDGKGMLLEQAALSFRLWTEREPSIPTEEEIFI